MPQDDTWIIPVFIVITLGWITSSLYYMVKSIMVWRDGERDVAAREELGLNSGRERLARLVVFMGQHKTGAFAIWLVAGLYAISPWSVTQTGPVWRRLIVPTCLIIGQQLIGRSLLRFHNERRDIFEKDRADEITRLEHEAVTAQAILDRTDVGREKGNDDA